MYILEYRKAWPCLAIIPGSSDEGAGIGGVFAVQENCGLDNCGLLHGLRSELGVGILSKEVPIVSPDTGIPK